MGVKGKSPIKPLSKDGGESLAKFRVALESQMSIDEIALFIGCSARTAKKYKLLLESGDQITERRGRKKKSTQGN